ncbi:MAG: hypothetical protein HC837_11495 [Chloroflexaceae bacterium]|nr:hypothetical protein [Chloroflexaceae bacterium]
MALQPEQSWIIGYRWGAWLLASLLVLIGPDQFPAQPPVHPGLLLVLTSVALIGLSWHIHPYVNLLQRQPLWLLPDMFFGMALIWASGGGIVPFLPFALGSLLVVAAIIRTWGGAMLAAVIFVTSEQIMLTFSGMADGMSWMDVLIRILVPIAMAALSLLMLQMFCFPRPRTEPADRRIELPSPTDISESQIQMEKPGSCPPTHPGHCCALSNLRVFHSHKTIHQEAIHLSQPLIQMP